MRNVIEELAIIVFKKNRFEGAAIFSLNNVYR